MSSNNGNKPRNKQVNNSIPTNGGIKNTNFSEGELKKSFQPNVRPDVKNTIPSVNPKTIPKKK